jgi:hypothetical protein
MITIWSDKINQIQTKLDDLKVLIVGDEIIIFSKWPLY